MKIQKLIFLTLLSCFAISCSKDAIDEQLQDNQSEADFSKRQLAGDFDNSFAGIYKGLFTTNDGLIRGTLVLSMDPDNQSVAQLTLSSGEKIKFIGSEDLSNKRANSTSKNLNFSTVGGNAITAAFDFSVENNGLIPAITNTNFGTKESSIYVAKELSRAPLNTITGTYERTSGSGGFAASGRTFNVMSAGPGDQMYTMQIYFRNGIYTYSGNQSNCMDISTFITACDIDGTATVAGAAINWSGTHTYDNFEDNQGCSEFSGTWAAPSYGNSVGTFQSDSDCDSGIEIVNDVCTSASTINLGDSIDGVIAGSSNSDSPDFCDDDLAGTADGNGVWYMFSSTSEVDVTFETNGSALDTQMRIFSGSCDSLVCLDNDDDDGDGLASLISLTAMADESYYIYISGYNGAEDSFQLNAYETLEPISFDLDLTCGEFMIDNGEDGDYSTDSVDTYSIDAGVGNTVNLVFSEFNVENTWDFVRVYDGADTTAPQITMSVGGNSTYVGTGERYGFTGTGTNSLVDDSVVSTGQFMTVVFYSDVTVVRPGFVAEVLCTAGRAELGLSRTSLTYTPSVILSNNTKETETFQTRKGQMKTEAYYNSQL